MKKTEYKGLVWWWNKIHDKCTENKAAKNVRSLTELLSATNYLLCANDKNNEKIFTLKLFLLVPVIEKQIYVWFSAYNCFYVHIPASSKGDVPNLTTQLHTKSREYLYHDPEHGCCHESITEKEACKYQECGIAAVQFTPVDSCDLVLGFFLEQGVRLLDVCGLQLTYSNLKHTMSKCRWVLCMQLYVLCCCVPSSYSCA
jgi:hypothetical protein